ncbi:MAG: DNA polymerase III subunit delta' [Bacteroidales bacterium]|nr:DNA polymerase III subunit delta' [Bacteroidales bacterium]
MYFKDIPGQREIKKRLINSVHENRISHALLFHGPEGSGKLALAIAYARYISCTSRGADDACGICASCVKYNKLAHPDLHFSFPSSARDSDSVVEDLMVKWRAAVLENPYMNQYNWYEKIGLENKQGIIGTKESSQIIRKLSLKSYESEYKILIMWFPERMNGYSANKLLKLIEEPAGKTLFVLVSENPDDVLPTIRSRTQILRIPKIKDEDVRIALEMNGVSPELVKDSVRLANGNFNLALASVQADEQNKTNFDRFMRLMRLAFAKKVNGLIDWVDEISRLSREQQKLFLLYSLRLVRENFMISMGKENMTHMAGYEQDFSAKFSKFIKLGNVGHIYEELNAAYNHISANGYARIVFLDMSLKMIRFLHM